MKVKWGVLGTAHIAEGATIPGLQKAENCELYAIAGRTAEKANAFKERFGFQTAYADDDASSGYEKLLADPAVEAVYIPLPNHLHREWTLRALKAGKHVLCEKPMALNEEEAKEMFAAAEENHVILMEAYAYLHSPYMESLQRDAERLGDLLYIDTAFVTQGYRENVRLYKEMGGGMLYDLGCYCTTMILSLVGAPLDYAKACAELTDQGVDAFAGAILRFANGTRAAFNVGMVLGENTHARYDRLFIRGTKGEIRSDVPFNAQGELRYQVTVDGKTETRTVTARSNYTLEAEQLARAIRGIESPRVTKEFTLRNARLLDILLKEAGY